ncbi:MAG TPA: YafY family protein [Steroidobacteraceae bacterium]|nr:YafY family protein [Steroidobacteraceae bacterium]
MTRTQRLFELLQILRRHRRPVTAEFLATELGISIRSSYRDIATLQQQGANIEGAAGVGYRLKPGFTLPPLMFREEELEALILGTRWVADRGDERLALAANDALAKIESVLPTELRDSLQSSGMLVGPGKHSPAREVANKWLPSLRRAIRNERKVRIAYVSSENQTVKERVLWPIAIGFFDDVRVLVAWCELRAAFRHFRVDRIETFTELHEPLPRRRRALLNEWRKSEGVRDS